MNEFCLSNVRKKISEKLKFDLEIGNIPFREDDERTKLWKRFCECYCKDWLIGFWRPVVVQIEKNSCKTTSNCINFVNTWILTRLYDEHRSIPLIIKEILSDLFRVVDESNKGLQQNQSSNWIKNLVFMNLFVLRFLASGIFLVLQDSNPLFMVAAQLSKLLIQIVSNAIVMSQEQNQSTDPLVKSTSLIHSAPLKIFVQRLTKRAQRTPFDVRRHMPFNHHPNHHTEPNSENESLAILTSDSSGLVKNAERFNRHMVHSWSTDKIQEFLFDNKLYDVMESFRRLNINGQSFLNMNESFIKNQLGVHRLAYKKRLLKLLHFFSSSSSSSSNTRHQ